MNPENEVAVEAMADVSNVAMNPENEVAVEAMADVSNVAMNPENEVAVEAMADVSNVAMNPENEVAVEAMADVSDVAMNPENEVAVEAMSDVSNVAVNPEDEVAVEAVAGDANPKKRKDRRVGINPIEERGELNTTFTKRRQGLFKKLSDFCPKFGAQAAAIAFSKSGNLYAVGDPYFYPVLERFVADPSSSVAKKAAETQFLCGPESTPAEPAPTVAMEERINEALGKGQPAWDMILENLDLDQLQVLEDALQVVITKIAACDVMTHRIHQD